MIFQKNKMQPLNTVRLGDRVTFVGNLDKNDVSVTLADVQIFDEGLYNCYVRNPPDRVQGLGVIELIVVTECMSVNLDVTCLSEVAFKYGKKEVNARSEHKAKGNLFQNVRSEHKANAKLFLNA